MAEVGGDKGGGTFKMAIQIVNILHPNSPNNTYRIQQKNISSPNPNPATAKANMTAIYVLT